MGTRIDIDFIMQRAADIDGAGGCNLQISPRTMLKMCEEIKEHRAKESHTVTVPPVGAGDHVHSGFPFTILHKPSVVKKSPLFTLSNKLIVDLRQIRVISPLDIDGIYYVHFVGCSIADALILGHEDDPRDKLIAAWEAAL